MMRFALLAVVFALCPLNAMADTPDALEGAWLAEDIGGGGVLDRVQTTIEFHEDGKVSGSGGCNRIIGTAEIEGDSLAFGPLGATRMACTPAVMDQENKFLAALGKAVAFRIDAEKHKLFLLDASGKEVVTLSRHDG